MKRNRAGNPMTINLYNAIDVINFQDRILADRCIENINMLVEIRDNSIHFLNKSIGFSARL